jgi:sarcosine oxidase gamma subunit
MSTSRDSAATLAIDGPHATRALEFRSFAFPSVGTATAELPSEAGAVQRDERGAATLLHFAPGHFLAPAPSEALKRHLAALEATGIGAGFDVEGKWQQLTLSGGRALRVLAAAIDVRAVLQHRECAAVTLFDCTAVLATRPDGFDVWVEASYATDFRAMLDRVSRQD